MFLKSPKERVDAYISYHFFFTVKVINSSFSNDKPVGTCNFMKCMNVISKWNWGKSPSSPFTRP